MSKNLRRAFGGGGNRLESSLQRGEEAIVHERLASVTSAGEGDLDVKISRDIDVKSVTEKIYYHAPLSLGEVVSAIFENSCNTHHNEQQPLSIVIPSDSDGIQSINNQIKLQGETMNNLTEMVYSPLTTHNSLKKSAFTLAEVLITLGIIGVVAALTIPSLIQKYEEKQTVSQVKKAYSEISQAYMSAVQGEGTPDNWGLVSWSDTGIDEHNILYHLKPYLKFTEYCGSETYNCWVDTKSVSGATFQHKNSKIYSRAILSDGTAILSLMDRADCSTTVGVNGQIKGVCGTIRIDVNGKRFPNMMGRDVFSFWVTKDKIVPTGTQLENKSSNSSFENGCVGQAEGRGCTAWLLYNENMDYLHCPDKLGWDKAKSCKE